MFINNSTQKYIFLSTNFDYFPIMRVYSFNLFLSSSFNPFLKNKTGIPTSAGTPVLNLLSASATSWSRDFSAGRIAPQ